MHKRPQHETRVKINARPECRLKIACKECGLGVALRFFCRQLSSSDSSAAALMISNPSMQAITERKQCGCKLKQLSWQIATLIVKVTHSRQAVVWCCRANCVCDRINSAESQNRGPGWLFDECFWLGLRLVFWQVFWVFELPQVDSANVPHVIGSWHVNTENYCFLRVYVKSDYPEKHSKTCVMPSSGCRDTRTSGSPERRD